VVPVVVVALLLIAGIFFWRRRKQKKQAEEQRRNEIEDYGYNPNNDPTLPAVGAGAAGGSEMTEDDGGYRGWGNSNRKASTTLSGGLTGAAYSDGGSKTGYHSPGSPTHNSDQHSGDPLVGNRNTMDSDTIGALGAGPAAAAGAAAGVRRGPSNASSSYSAGAHSDHSDQPPLPTNNPHDYYTSDNTYYPQGPYDQNGYGNGQPVIRDVQARRNTRIESGGARAQAGSAGIAQNF